MQSIIDDLPLNIVLLVILFGIVTFENERWVRARAEGMRGANPTATAIVGTFVDLTWLLGGSVWYLFLFAYGFDTSFLPALSLFLLHTVTRLIWSVVAIPRTRMYRMYMLGYHIWVVSSLLVLPIGLHLIFQTTLFGFFSIVLTHNNLL